jgi:hypothetical protein
MLTHAIRIILFFFVTFVTVANGQTNLVLPTGPDDMRELMRNVETGPCTLCGIVTNVRSKQRAALKSIEQPRFNGPELIATPIVGKGDSVKRARERDRETTIYTITVLYDNGQYAAFDQDEKPFVRKGDKVKVVDGRVLFRQ